MSSNPAERLRDAVLARRNELELSQLDIWQAGGPSNTKQTEIENARTTNLTRTTARKLDAALRWEEGSAKRVWEGRGEPTPVLEDLSSRNSQLVREHLREQIAAAGLNSDMTAALLEVLDEEVRGA